jgi:hypothetical protein
MFHSVAIEPDKNYVRSLVKPIEKPVIEGPNPKEMIEPETLQKIKDIQTNQKTLNYLEMKQIGLVGIP